MIIDDVVVVIVDVDDGGGCGCGDIDEEDGICETNFNASEKCARTQLSTLKRYEDISFGFVSFRFVSME